MFPFGPRHGVGLQVVKKVPSGFRKRLSGGQIPGEAEGPLKGCGLHRLLVMPDGEPFKELLARRLRRSQVSPISPMSFTCCPRKGLSRSERRVCVRRTGAGRAGAWVGFVSRATAAATAAEFYPHVLEEGVATTLALQLQRRFSPPRHALCGHIIVGGTDA